MLQILHKLFLPCYSSKFKYITLCSCAVTLAGTQNFTSSWTIQVKSTSRGEFLVLRRSNLVIPHNLLFFILSISSTLLSYKKGTTLLHKIASSIPLYFSKSFLIEQCVISGSCSIRLQLNHMATCSCNCTKRLSLFLTKILQ